MGDLWHGFKQTGHDPYQANGFPARGLGAWHDLGTGEPLGTSAIARGFWRGLFFIDLARKQIIAPAHQAVEKQQAIQVIDLVLHGARLVAIHLIGM